MFFLIIKIDFFYNMFDNNQKMDYTLTDFNIITIFLSNFMPKDIVSIVIDFMFDTYLYHCVELKICESGTNSTKIFVVWMSIYLFCIFVVH